MPGRSYILLVQRKLLTSFSFFFKIHFGKVYTWSKFWSKDLFIVNFFLSKRAAFCSKYEFSLLKCYIFCSSLAIMGRIMKMYSNHFDGELWPGYLVYQFCFYMPHPRRSCFLKSLFFEIILKLFYFGKAAKVS